MAMGANQVNAARVNNLIEVYSTQCFIQAVLMNCVCNSMGMSLFPRLGIALSSVFYSLPRQDLVAPANRNLETLRTNAAIAAVLGVLAAESIRSFFTLTLRLPPTRADMMIVSVLCATVFATTGSLEDITNPRDRIAAATRAIQDPGPPGN